MRDSTGRLDTMHCRLIGKHLLLPLLIGLLRAYLEGFGMYM